MTYRIMHLEGTNVFRIEEFVPARWYYNGGKGYWRVSKSYDDTGSYPREFNSHLAAAVALERLEKQDSEIEQRANGRWVQVRS